MSDAEELSIRSAFICIGTVRCAVIRPTVVSTDYITINVKESINFERLSLQIAFKHISRAIVSFEGHERGLALHVNRYCAKRIRDSLLLEHNSNTADTCNAMYFDPESQHRCEKYIVIDIKACGREDLRKLDLRLSNVQKRKADGSLMPKNANIPNEPFLQVMNAEDYEKLLKDLDVQLITSQHRASHHRGNHSLSMRHQPSNSATSTLPPPTTTTMLYTSSHSDNSNFHTPGNKRRSIEPASMEYENERNKQARPVMMITRNNSSVPTSPPLITVPIKKQSSSALRSPQTNPQSGLSSYTVIAAPVMPCAMRFGQIDARQISIVETSTPRSHQMQQQNYYQHYGVSNNDGNGSIYNIDNNQNHHPTVMSMQVPSTSAANTTMIPIVLKDGTRMLTRQAAQRKVIHMIDEDDGVDPKKDVDLSQGNLLVYPVGEKDAVPIHFADVECLKPEQMLNDVIIDFFLKHIHYESIPLERRSSVFVFNSFFYGKLSNCNGGIPPHSAVARSKWIMSNYKSVRNWTKNVDLFSKEYIVVPINEDIHWYLAIIVHPSAAIEVPNAIEANDESQKKRRRKTYIIVLDSLMDDLDPKRKLTAAVLREYLECEYNDKRKQKAVDGERFAKELVEKITPRELPQQRNYTDCGLFLLKYAECFLVNPPQLITQSDSFLRWYPRFTIKNMRSAILDKVKSLCDPQKWSAYEEYSKGRECDVQTTQHTIEPFSTETTGISIVLPFRSDSPKPRLRSYSTGDEQEEVTTEMRRPLTP